MFDISELKAKKLPELQEIAKGINVPKFRSLKKLDLVYKILDLQAADPKKVEAVVPKCKEEAAPAPKPKQERKPRTPRAPKATTEAKANTPEDKKEVPAQKEAPAKKEAVKREPAKANVKDTEEAKTPQKRYFFGTKTT